MTAHRTLEVVVWAAISHPYWGEHLAPVEPRIFESSWTMTAAVSSQEDSIPGFSRFVVGLSTGGQRLLAGRRWWGEMVGVRQETWT